MTYVFCYCSWPWVNSLASVWIEVLGNFGVTNMQGDVTQAVGQFVIIWFNLLNLYIFELFTITIYLLGEYILLVNLDNIFW